MSSLKQQLKPDNRQKAEFEIERGDMKIRALIPERLFVFCVMAVILAFLAYNLLN